TGYMPPEYGLKSGAVIEIESDAVRPAAWLGEATLGAGSDAARSVRAMSGGPIGERISPGLSAGAERSGPVLEPVHPANFHNEGGVVSGDGRINVIPSNRDLLRANVVGGRSRYDVPHGEIEEEARQNQRQSILQRGMSAYWQRSWSDRISSSVSTYYRRVDAEVSNSPNDTPITSSSTRRLTRLGGLASVAYDRGSHSVKAGVEGSRLDMDELFTFAVTNPTLAREGGISSAAR